MHGTGHQCLHAVRPEQRKAAPAAAQMPCMHASIPHDDHQSLLQQASPREHAPCHHATGVRRRQLRRAGHRAAAGAGHLVPDVRRHLCAVDPDPPPAAAGRSASILPACVHTDHSTHDMRPPSTYARAWLRKSWWRLLSTGAAAWDGSDAHAPSTLQGSTRTLCRARSCTCSSRRLRCTATWSPSASSATCSRRSAALERECTPITLSCH